MTPISICVIAKNEEKNIRTFLSSIQKSMGKYPYEIVLVDTGSTDCTREIAREFNVRLFSFEWINDFSAARNFSISKASYKWILVLDCDEYATRIETDCFEQMMQQYPSGVGLITRHNQCLSSAGERVYTDYVNRFFPKKKYHYEGIVHEQLVAKNHQPYEMVTLPIEVNHVGYIGSQISLEQKATRDSALLLEMLEQNPNDPYLYFQLGQSATLTGDMKNAYRYYKKGLSFDINPELEYVRLMLLGYGESALKLGYYKEVLEILENVLDDFDNTPEFSCLLGRAYRLNGQYINAMKAFLKATTYPSAAMEGSNTYIPLYHMGYINEMLGDNASARKLYENCGNYAPAKDRLAVLAGK